MALRPANTYTAFVDPGYTESERKQIGIAIVNYIVDRTKRGLGVGKKPFKNSKGQSRYSENYIKTPDFKTGGKSINPINLTLTGDMLDSLEVLDTSLIGRIVIGFSDETQSDKSVFMQEKGYDFVGLTKPELNEILNEFGEPSQEPRPANISRTFVESFVRGLLGR